MITFGPDFAAVRFGLSNTKVSHLNAKAIPEKASFSYFIFFFLDCLNHASQGNPLAVYILYIWPTRRWVNLYLHILETDITQTTFCICSQFGR